MQKMLRCIVENTSTGKIDKRTAAELLKLAKSEMRADKDIAIIGIGASLPGDMDVETFWQALESGIDCISPFPLQRRQDIDRYLKYIGADDEGPITYFEGAYLDAIDHFDYRFFKISPQEARLMDPYQRMFMQTAYHALEDGGYVDKQVKGSKTGVFVGYASNIKDSYQKMIHDTARGDMAAAAVGNVTAMLPSRISYLLDLRGPSMVLDSACSSGLLAVHQACNALKNGDCEMALAGSVRINMIPLDRAYMRFGIEASDGRTRSFDDLSDGAGMGEGIIAFLLKPIDTALRDKDHIYGVIKGSAVNQDGTSIGITAPNPAAQTQVVQEAWENAGIKPQQLTYIETHGTGTPIGDPIEMEGLEKAFRKHSKAVQICPVGTVKSITGHLYESAGSLGLLKVLLMMKYQTLPPSIHFKVPNSRIDFAQSPFYMNTKPRACTDESMVCGISSFGFSGTNCHMVVARHQGKAREPVEPVQHVFTLSAQSPEALSRYIDIYQNYLGSESSGVSLADLCYTASARRAHHTHRVALVCSNVEQLENQLHQLAEQGVKTDGAKGIYHGAYRVVPATKTNKEANEVSAGDLRGLAVEADKVVKAFAEGAENTVELLGKLAQLYCRGAGVGWEALYRELPVQNRPLPLYPFEKNRCWIDIPEPQKASGKKIEGFNAFTAYWVKKPLSETESLQYPEGTTLVFRNPDDQLHGLVQELKVQGQAVIEVYPGETFEAVGSRQYTLNPVEEQYLELFRAVDLQSIGRIIHGTTVRSKALGEGADGLKESLEQGVYSLFYMTKALNRIGFNKIIDLVILTAGSAWVEGYWELMRPENATVAGIGKVIKKEHPELDCRCVDIDETVQWAALVKELGVVSAEYHVAYKDGVRYVQGFKELDTDQAPDRALPIKDTGVYLITGGLGGIGLESAKYLASKGKINLAMVNRTPILPKDQWDSILSGQGNEGLKDKITKLLELEALGAEVTCYSTDVSDYHGIKAVIEDIRRKHQRINGIVHGAGVGGAEQIITRSEAAFKEVFDPKVLGTWNLHCLTLKDNLDIFVSFSSIASLFSAPGQGDYIAANGYLDAFSYYRNGMGLPSATVNWSTWRETGMSVKHDFTVDTVFKMLMTKDGIAGFAKALNKQLPQIVVGELNFESKVISLLSRFQLKFSPAIENELVKRTGTVKTSGGNKKQNITQVTLTGKTEGYTAMEQAIGTIWGRVLGFETLDVYDNFYDLGGDSILGLRIANIVHDELSIAVNPADMIKYLTIDEVGQHLSTLRAETPTGQKIERVESREYYETSSAQKRIYSQYLIGRNSVTYNLSKALIVEGTIDLKRLNQALSQIVERHENLRTTFHLMDDGLMQKVHPAEPMACIQVPWNVYSVDTVLEDFVKPFDLSKGPLMRLGYCAISEAEGVLLLDMHHIITDGVSMDILVTELLSLYQGLALEPLPIQYKDYAHWQSSLKCTETMEQHRDFWLELLKAQLHQLDLPTDYQREGCRQFAGETLTLKLEEALAKSLKAQARALNVSMYMMTLSGFLVLMHKYSAQEDIVIGSPSAGRPNSDAEKLIGMFVNTLTLRHRVQRETSLKDLVVQVKDQCLECFKHQDFQFDDVVKALGVPRENNRHPLFDVMFVFQNVGNTTIQLEDMNFKVHPYHNKISKFDLTLEVVPEGESFILGLNYATELYRAETAERIVADYIGVLQAMVADAGQKVGDVQLPSFGAMEHLETEEIDVSFNF